MRRSLGGRVAKVKFSLGVLRDIADSQVETSLLRLCLALPKVSFILRTCPISHIRHTAEEFDNAVRDALETTMGRPMSDWSWLKTSLPGVYLLYIHIYLFIFLLSSL